MAFAWLSGLAGLAGTVLGGPAAGAAAAAAVSSLGGGDGANCPGPSLAEVSRAFQVAPRDRIARLEQIWATVHKGQSFPLGSPQTFLTAIKGGSDCKVTSTNGQTLQAEGFAFVREFGAGAPGSVASSGWGNPTQPAPQTAYEQIHSAAWNAQADVTARNNSMLMIGIGVLVVIVAVFLLRGKKGR